MLQEVLCDDRSDGGAHFLVMGLGDTGVAVSHRQGLSVFGCLCHHVGELVRFGIEGQAQVAAEDVDALLTFGWVLICR